MLRHLALKDFAVVRAAELEFGDGMTVISGETGAGKSLLVDALGFLSGLLGAGGGFLSVPFMTWCNVAIHNAVATSAALGFPIAVFNVIGYVLGGWSVAGRPEWSVGYVWLPALAVIASCT